MKQLLPDPEVFAIAARLIAGDRHDYACLAIDDALFELRRIIFDGRKEPEYLLFKKHYYNRFWHAEGGIWFHWGDVRKRRIKALLHCRDLAIKMREEAKE